MQTTLFPETDFRASADKTDTSSTFADNLSLPVHRWFRFSAGFSALWAEQEIRAARDRGETRVFDPFAGSGTTLLAAESAGVEAIGVEAQPFVYRIARAKLLHRSDPGRFAEMARRVRDDANRRTPEIDGYPTLIQKCYTPDALGKLDVLRRSLEHFRDESDEWRLVWLSLVGILRSTSSAGTAQWQYVLPRKEKKRTLDPFDAFEAQSRLISDDMHASRAFASGPAARVLETDARACEGVPEQFATLVLTSPPYPNNYDYADATRLEMCFLGEIKGWGELQSKVRSRLVRSCSQHVPEKAVHLHRILSSDELAPIRAEITEVCSRLAEVRMTKGGKKTYHLMVACYFHDLAQVWRSLRRVCATPSRVCFVVGDSAPYGVYVPVVEWLGKIAEAAGFSDWRFEETRKRNVKWKNRKHRVPLCEGRFCAEG